MENISAMCSNIKKGGDKQLLRLKNELEMVAWIRNVSGFFFFKMEMESFALFKYVKPPWQKLNLI